MVKQKGKPTPREIRSQHAQLHSHPHGNEKGIKWPMAVKDGAREDSGSSMDTGLKGTDNGSRLLEIQRSLDADKNLSGYGLKADYTGDTLQITGIVDTLEDKRSLKTLLTDLKVPKFADGVSISTDGQVLDSHVAQEVREELAADPRLEGADISVHCLAGKVFLTGDVESRRQENLAVSAARKSRGVTIVVSQLQHLPGNMDADSIFHSQVNNDREWNPSWKE